MKIAQVAPFYESIPPKLYGGTERVVSFLVEELVRRGHDVTLYASGDSLTSARLVPAIEKALRLNPCCSEILSLQALQLERVFQDLKFYDIVHFHTDYLHFPLSRRLSSNQVTTLHGRLDLPGTIRLFEEYTDIPVISISDNQRLPLPRANWQGTVYNGIDKTPYILHPEPGCYLACLGDALALIFPIQWPEPFGLVMIESLACGTPVVTFNRGSVPEIIQNAVTGFIVESIDDAVAAVGRLGMISRYKCRDVFDKRFSSEIMADGYLNVYNKLVAKSLIPQKNIYNYDKKTLAIDISFSIDADYSDIFEVRGLERKKRGVLQPVKTTGKGINLGYRGLDKILYQTSVEYERKSVRGILQQGWKDSNDSIFHEDGSNARGPIALCEVQAYVYEAKLQMSKMANILGHTAQSLTLGEEASTLKKKFHKYFWLEDLNTYALALDGAKNPCKVRSSNAGHALFCEIADEKSAKLLVQTLLSNKSFSGWGIRTIAAGEARYGKQ